MLDKAKSLADHGKTIANKGKGLASKSKDIADKGKSRLLSWRQESELTPEDVLIARDYIRTYWTKLQRFHPNDDESLIGLPKPYLVPSYAEGHEFDYDEM